MQKQAVKLPAPFEIGPYRVGCYLRKAGGKQFFVHINYGEEEENCTILDAAYPLDTPADEVWRAAAVWVGQELLMHIEKVLHILATGRLQ